MSAFEYWLKLQEHKWNERNKRYAAINNLRGSSLSVEPFPVIYSAEKGLIKRKGDKRVYRVDDTDECMALVEQLIWGEN